MKGMLAHDIGLGVLGVCPLVPKSLVFNQYV
jgi:hypothetical protein